MKKSLKIASVALASLLAAGILQAAAVIGKPLLPKRLQQTARPL